MSDYTFDDEKTPGLVKFVDNCVYLCMDGAPNVELTREEAKLLVKAFKRYKQHEKALKRTQRRMKKLLIEDAEHGPEGDRRVLSCSWIYYP